MARRFELPPELGPSNPEYGSYEAMRQTLDLPRWTALRQYLWKRFPEATTIDIDLLQLAVLKRWARQGRS